jgi:hypothetical protein
MRVKIRIGRRRRGKCLVCAKRLSLVQRLMGRRFCCEQHQEQYLAELRALEFTRLRDAGERGSRASL